MTNPDQTSEHVDLMIEDILAKVGSSCDQEALARIRAEMPDAYLGVLDDVIDCLMMIPPAMRLDVMVRLSAVLLIRDRINDLVDDAA